MTRDDCVAVFGASGFVGSRVVEALEARGSRVMRVAAPRLEPVAADRAAGALDSSGRLRDEIGRALLGATAVVNAAGNPDASSNDEPQLMAANAACAALLASVAREQGIRRFVHVSSAVVQGAVPVLTEDAWTQPFSPYSRSKALGEQLVVQYGPGETVIYRPPSVHNTDRRVTRAIHRLASSRLSATVAPGTAHSPQALLYNVADAVAYLALCPVGPPTFVIHPWEGLTTAGLLEALGGKAPRLVPRSLAKAMLATLKGVSGIAPKLEANRRRIELLWLGQEQASSWLSRSGWVPPRGPEGWRELRDELKTSSEHVRN